VFLIDEEGAGRMWHLALRNLWQRRLRSFLTALGIAVAIQVNLTMTSIISGYESDLKSQLGVLDDKVLVQRLTTNAPQMEEFPSAASSIDNSLVESLLELEGVDPQASAAILYVPLASPPIAGLPPASCAVGIEPGHEGAFLGEIAADVGITTLQGSQSVILGQDAARQFGKEGGPPVVPGEMIEFLDRSFTVVGVLESAPDLFQGLVLMDLATSKELFERPGSVTAMILATEGVEYIESIKDAIPSLDSGLQAASQEDVAAAGLKMLSITAAYTNTMNSAVIVVVFLFISIVMIVAVMEQRRAIGILRAIGAQRRAILNLVACESLVLSLAGALLAWPIWSVVGTLIGGGYSSPVELILTAWWQIASLAFVVGIGAALLPAWRAVRVDPLEALRY
jgi:ABC-type lipoprotein release transport system permease subunit